MKPGRACSPDCGTRESYLAIAASQSREAGKGVFALTLGDFLIVRAPGLNPVKPGRACSPIEEVAALLADEELSQSREAGKGVFAALKRLDGIELSWAVSIP